MPKKMTKLQIEAEAAYAEKAWKDRARLRKLAADIASGKSQPVTIRLETFDLNLAKQQAAKAGVRYQTYIKALLHDALAAVAPEAAR